MKPNGSFHHLFLFLLALLAGCTEDPSVRTAQGALMSLAVGNQWVGRVQSKGGKIIRFDTVRVDTVLRVDTVEWFHLNERGGTAAPRPDWIGGTYLATRSDGLYTPLIQSPPRAGAPVHRRMRYPVAVGDTAIDFGWFQESSAEGSGEGRAREIGIVTAIDEEIDVPAGRFTAFRVELQRLTESGRPGMGIAMYRYLWLAPGPGLIRAESHSSSGEVDQVWELVGRESPESESPRVESQR